MKSVTNRIKLFVLDPLWNDLTTKEQIKTLRGAGYELHVDSTPRALSGISSLFIGQEPRVLAINPDYVNWKLKNEDYANIPNLKAIFVSSTAFDWIEQDVTTERIIPISNITNFSTQAVAEWAIFTALSLARQTPRLIKDGFPLNSDLDYMKYAGIELKGKRAGIIGLGNIGSAIAERCAGMGMEVIYYSRSVKNTSYKSMELEEVVKTADVVFPALANNPETRQLMGMDVTKHVKQGAILVDITNGLFNHQQALNMISSGQLYGYGFEAKPGEFPTFAGNIWAAPAYAWVTYESMYNSEVKIIENLLQASKGNYPARIN